MAIICRDHRLLFIMVPGTGCSVVGKLLIEEFGGEWIPSSNVIVDNRIAVQRKHSRLPDLIRPGLLTPGEVEEYLVFATVRNPFDRLVTYYQRLIGPWVEYSHGVRRRAIERLAESTDRGRYDTEIAALNRDISRSYRRRQLLNLSGFNGWVAFSVLRQLALDRFHATNQDDQKTEYLFPMLEGVDVVMKHERLEEALNDILQYVGISRSITLPRKNVTQGKRHYSEYYSGFTRSLITSYFKDQLSRFGYEFSGPAESGSLVWLNDAVSSKQRAA